jgi:hypothetical protein
MLDWFWSIIYNNEVISIRGADTKQILIAVRYGDRATNS